MIANISELKKGNGKLYMVHGNLDITMVYLRFTELNHVIHSEISAKQRMENIKESRKS